MIGILAYGSLIANPGIEIQVATTQMIFDLETPFAVEYARLSIRRNDAPTLVPVPFTVGDSVKALILLLDTQVSLAEARHMLYRRETNRVNDQKVKYNDDKQRADPGRLVIELDTMADVPIIYTRLAANIPIILDASASLEQKAAELARLAVESLNQETYCARRDGIQYLSDNITAGVSTQLTPLYQHAILQQTGTPDLGSARELLAKQKGIIS